MNSMKNRVTLIGNIGREIDVKQSKAGRKYTKFSLATNESYNNNQGERITETQWHNITAFGPICDNLARLLIKGNEVVIEGKLSYGKYEDKDGIKRYTTDIILDQFHKLSKPDLPI